MQSVETYNKIALTLSSVKLYNCNRNNDIAMLRSTPPVALSMSISCMAVCV